MTVSEVFWAEGWVGCSNGKLTPKHIEVLFKIEFNAAYPADWRELAKVLDERGLELTANTNLPVMQWLCESLQPLFEVVCAEALQMEKADKEEIESRLKGNRS